MNTWSKLYIFEQFASTSEIFTQNSLQKFRPKASEDFGQNPPKISPKIASKVHIYLSLNAKLTKVSNQFLQPKRRNQMKRFCSQQSSEEKDKVYHHHHHYYEQKDDDDGSTHTYLAALLEQNTH